MSGRKYYKKDMRGESIYRAKKGLNIWHFIVGFPCLVLGIASCARSAVFVQSGGYYSLNGFVAAGIWSGLSFTVIGAFTAYLVERNETGGKKVFWRRALYVSGIFIAGALFVISIYSAFYNDVRCPLDQNIRQTRSRRSNSLKNDNNTLEDGEEAKDDQVNISTTTYQYRWNRYYWTTTESSPVKYEFSTRCKHRNELVGLDATMMMIGLVEMLTMAASLIMDVRCCSWNCFRWKLDFDKDDRDYVDMFSAFQIFFGVGSMVLGVACTAHQSLMMNVSPDFWSLNGFIGTGIWSGAYLIILSYIQIRAVEKQRVPSFLLSFFLAAVGVLDLLTVIILSIFSAFVTNQPCTLEEYQRRVICKGRYALVGLDVSLMVLAVIQLICLVGGIVRMSKRLESTSEIKSPTGMICMQSLTEKIRQTIRRLRQQEETTVTVPQKITGDAKLAC